MQIDVHEKLIRFEKARKLTIRRIAQSRQNESVNRLLKKRYDDAGNEMNRQRRFPLPCFKRKSSRQINNQRAKREPDVTGNHLPR